MGLQLSENKGKTVRIASDSTFLLAVKVTTMLVSIVQTMILARAFSEEEYGTYSQALLIVAVFTPLLSLGLDNAVTFFFNSSPDEAKRSKYIATIIVLAFAIGAIGGIVLVMCNVPVAEYFSNKRLAPLVILVAFRPLAQNFLSILQNLFVSNGMSKVVAVRNLIISVAQISIVGACALLTTNLFLLLALLLALDVVQIGVFAFYYQHHAERIQITQFYIGCIKPILSFALPMFLSLSAGMISVNIGKLLIGNMMSVEEFALYSNVSKELPFGFVVSSITVVVTPVIVKYISSGDESGFKRLWGEYIHIGYIVTWALCASAFVAAPQLIDILYSSKYLTEEGVLVFRIFIFGSMVRFTYFALIPTATGNTKIILRYTLLNMILSVTTVYPFYLFMGMVGVAMSAVISSLLPSIFFLRKSAQLVHVRLKDVIDFGQCGAYIAELFLACGVGFVFIGYLDSLGVDSLLEFILAFFVVTGSLLLLQFKKLKQIVMSLNQYRI